MVSAMSRVRGTDQTMRGRFTNWGALLQPRLLLLGHATTYQARKILRTKFGQLLNTFQLKPSIPNMMDKEQRKRRCWLRLEWTKCYHCCLSFGKGNALLMLKCVHCVNFVDHCTRHFASQILSQTLGWESAWKWHRAAGRGFRFVQTRSHSCLLRLCWEGVLCLSCY